MRLLSCRLRQVRLHRDLNLQFGRQFTLIGGPNEAGKSTLVEALHKGLFLRSTATGRGVEELRSRLHAGLPEVEISFEAAGQTWQLRKRFAGSSGTCQLSNGSGLALNGAAAEEQLAQLLGVDGPVEGRRIAMLPERWAHLWVRQGEASSNPIAGQQHRYDFARLVDQLQQRGGSGAIESALDRAVLEQLQDRVSQLFTATGRVKAGSPLAEAQQREQACLEQLGLAQQRLSELDTAMEQLRQIGERLQRIESNERPALLQRQAALAQGEQRRLQLQNQRQLALAEREPLLQRAEGLRLAQRQRQDWQQQQTLQLAEQQRQSQQLEQLLAEQAALQTRLQEHRQQRQRLDSQRQQQQQRQELAQLRLDQHQLQAEEQQLHEHQQQLQALQGEAEGLKSQLAALPAMATEQVRQLRQAEQALAQAEARCQAMAASLEVLEADEPIRLDGGTPLKPGERYQLTGEVHLQVGPGVVLRLSPGGGQALPQAQAEQQRSRERLTTLKNELGVPNSDAAETIERQRRDLEAELTTLRKAAAAIPWAGLQERIAALVPRRQRLDTALASLAHLAPDPEATDLLQLDRAGLELALQTLRSSSNGLNQELEQLTASQQLSEARERALQQQLTASRGRLDQLAGSLQGLAARLAEAEQQSGSAESLASQLEELEADLRHRQAQLDQLDAEHSNLGGAGDPNGAEAIAAALQQLEAEKDSLLTSRGQAEQRCASLGANDPAAELEQRQAAWEAAAEERASLELQGQALTLLQNHFHEAQSRLANRYSEPLREAIGPYLATLAATPLQPLLAFDPQQGFQDLQLRQGSETYGFDRLSGGMREQLAAALRLALAEVLHPAYDHCLPLVFDDAFTNSDRERLIGLKRMLRRGMEQGIQILLLSCHPQDYRDLDVASTQQKTPDERVNGGEQQRELPNEVVRVQLG
jgi:DNA repair exonuclease SbcCD ATPase subunit